MIDLFSDNVLYPTPACTEIFLHAIETLMPVLRPNEPEVDTFEHAITASWLPELMIETTPENGDVLLKSWYKELEKELKDMPSLTVVDVGILSNTAGVLLEWLMVLQKVCQHHEHDRVELELDLRLVPYR